MDHSFGVVEFMLWQALSRKDLTAFWGLFWETVEGAVITFADRQEDKASNRCRGRGETPVQMKLQKPLSSTELGDIVAGFLADDLISIFSQLYF